MKTLHLGDEDSSARELVEQAGEGPILLRDEHGRTFVLAEIDDADAEAMSLANNTQLLVIMQRSRSRAQAEGWLTTDQLRSELGI